MRARTDHAGTVHGRVHMETTDAARGIAVKLNEVIVGERQERRVTDSQQGLS